MTKSVWTPKGGRPALSSERQHPVSALAYIHEGVGIGVGTGVGIGVGTGVGAGVGVGVGAGVGIGVGAGVGIVHVTSIPPVRPVGQLQL